MGTGLEQLPDCQVGDGKNGCSAGAKRGEPAGRWSGGRGGASLSLSGNQPRSPGRPGGCRPPGAAGCAPGRWRGSSDRDNPQAGLVDAELETRRVGLPDTTASEETGTLTASPVVGHGGDRNSARVGARCQLGGRRKKRAWALPEPARGVGDLAACCPPPRPRAPAAQGHLGWGSGVRKCSDKVHRVRQQGWIIGLTQQVPKTSC